MRFIPHIPDYDRIPHGFCAGDEDEEGKEQEMEDMELQEVQTEVIKVVQLPIITEQLSKVKEKWEGFAADAEAMVCNEDTIQNVKKFRADINKDFNTFESLRKKVKESVMKPYNEFEAVYNECVTLPKIAAETALAKKANEFEEGKKQRCEENLREYFAELVAVHHLDWLTYERAGIKVDMASAKAKTPKKLREKLVAFVVGVSEDVERINSLENADEIMVEYQWTLNAASAIFTVQQRHRRIAEQQAAQEARTAVKASEAEMVRRVEALSTPAEVKQEKLFSTDFRATGTMEQLKALKQFAQANGIKLEGIK